MREDVLKNLEQIKFFFTAFRLSQPNRAVNLYLSDSKNLTYDNAKLISNEHQILLQAIKTLTTIDNQHVNHLFIQFFCLAYDLSENLKAAHSTVCFDTIKKQIYLANSSPSLFDEHTLVNFSSRERQGYFELDHLNFFALSAEDFPDLEIAHSEHLFIKYLNENNHLILDFLKSHDIDLSWRIEKIGINFYSSLDSCDNCQNRLLNFFNSESSFTKKIKSDLIKFGYNIQNSLFWQIIFFSEVPCKKSSYMAIKSNAETLFKYDKEKKIFISSEQPEKDFPFPCEIHALELKTLNEQLMVSQILSH